MRNSRGPRVWFHAIVVGCLAMASPGPGQADLPQSQGALVARLAEVLTSGDLEGYSEILAAGFTLHALMDSSVEVSRAQEVELTRQFLTRVATLDVACQITASTATDAGADLSLRMEITAVDREQSGYRIDRIQDLSVVQVDGGWQIHDWWEPQSSLDRPYTWYSLRLAFLDRETIVSGATWGTMKRRAVLGR